MLKLAVVGTTSLAVFGGGQPVFAQAAISEPGAYAFYHPDADVLNGAVRRLVGIEVGVVSGVFNLESSSV